MNNNINNIEELKITSVGSSKETSGTMSQNQDVFYGPSISHYEIAYKVTNNTKVYIIGTAFGFYHIQFVIEENKELQGYVPISSIKDISGPTPQEEVYYGGICCPKYQIDKTNNKQTLKIYTCDDFSKSNIIDELSAGETLLKLFDYNTENQHIAYVDYCINNVVKRGYVNYNDLIFPQGNQTAVGTINKAVNSYFGTDTKKYSLCYSFSENDFVSVLEQEGDWIYAEFNTIGGRRRGYIESSNLTIHNLSEILPEFISKRNAEKIETVVIKQPVIFAYAGPNENYRRFAVIMSPNNTVINYKSGFDKVGDFVYVDFLPPTSTEQNKKYYSGYISVESFDDIPPENSNHLTKLALSYPNFGNPEIYGQTQQGRDMQVYKAGTGEKNLYLIFAQHGWEDGFTDETESEYLAGDGDCLIRIAKNLIERFELLSDDEIKEHLKNWTIFIFPGINLDGIVEGTGVGYTGENQKNSVGVFGRCFFNGINSNRNWGGNFIADVNDEYRPLEKTGKTPCDAKEMQNLKNFLYKINTGSKKPVLLDIHGWLDTTIGHKTIGSYFYDNLHLKKRKQDNEYGTGYITTWAKNSTNEEDLPKTEYIEEIGLGADSCLIEFAPTYDYSYENIEESYGRNFFNGFIELLRDYLD